MAKAGVCTIVNKEKSIFEVLDLARDAGADGVEIWGRPPHVSCPPDRGRLARIAEHASHNNLKICAFGSYYRAGKETVFDGTPVTIENQVAAARELGAPLIRIWPGDKNRDDCTANEIDTVITDIRRFADTAAAFGQSVVLERHCNTIFNTWDGIDELLDSIGHPSVFLNYQIPSPASLEEYKSRSVDDYTRLLSRARHAHLQNYSGEKGGARTFLDKGVVDYSQLGRAAKNGNYTGYFMVEFPALENEGLSEMETIRYDIDFIKAL